MNRRAPGLYVLIILAGVSAVLIGNGDFGKVLGAACCTGLIAAAIAFWRYPA